jgi:hypothetical protein
VKNDYHDKDGNVVPREVADFDPFFRPMNRCLQQHADEKHGPPKYYLFLDPTVSVELMHTRLCDPCYEKLYALTTREGTVLEPKATFRLEPDLEMQHRQTNAA